MSRHPWSGVIKWQRHRCDTKLAQITHVRTAKFIPLIYDSYTWRVCCKLTNARTTAWREEGGDLYLCTPTSLAYLGYLAPLAPLCPAPPARRFLVC